MTVSVASFRADLPEFNSVSLYPDGVITYWLAMAKLLMGLGTGQSPPPVCSFTGSLALNKVLTVISIQYGSMSFLPLALQAQGIDINAAAVTAQLTGPPTDVGTYQCTVGANVGPEAMVALGSGAGAGGGNPFWGPSSVVPQSPPTTVADFATEMWVAHQIVLEKQAMDAARTGADPGAKIGVVNNKSVNGASIGFDVSAVAGGSMQVNAGYYNQTIYGMRFYRLMKVRGAGPIQIGIGYNPTPFMGFNNGGYLGCSNAWGGPYPGIAPGDTGFGS